MIVFVILLLYYCIGCDNKEISNLKIMVRVTGLINVPTLIEDQMAIDLPIIQCYVRIIPIVDISRQKQL